MSLEMALYLTDVLSNCGNMLGITVFLLSIGIIFMIAGTAITADQYKDSTHKWFKKLLIRFTMCFIILGIIGCLIPNKKTMYLIISTLTVKELSADPKAQETLSKILSVVNSKLDELSESDKAKDK